MPIYRAQGFITITVVAEYEADSIEEANKLALSKLDREAVEMLEGLYMTGDIDDIEVETVEE